MKEHAHEVTPWLESNPDPYESSDGNWPPKAYRSAVAWLNWESDELFHSEARSRFAEFIHRLLDPSLSFGVEKHSSIVDSLKRYVATTEDNNPKPGNASHFYNEFCEKFLAQGRKPKGVKPDDKGWDQLVSFVQIHTPIQPENVRINGIRGAFDRDLHMEDYLEWYFQENPRSPEIVWLTLYSELQNFIKNGDAREALSRVGVECYPDLPSGNKEVFLLRVDSNSIWEHLRVPTIADSFFYYLWGSSQEDENGRTRHTERGRDFGVPELVIRSEHLVNLIGSSKIELQYLDLRSDQLKISLEHIKERWEEEIKPEILK